MNNTEKLLRAFIEVSGYEIEEVKSVEKVKFSILKAVLTDRFNPQRDKVTIDYKVTKRNGKSELHRIVREYESGRCSVGDMLNEIAIVEGMLNEKVS